MNVVVNLDEERGFRRRALRAMPNEYMEVLYGFVEGDTINICHFGEIDHEGTQTRLECEPGAWEYCEWLAKMSGMELLGSIHTHPYRDHTMYSYIDAVSSAEYGETVLAVCAIDATKPRRKTIIDYWPAIKAMDVVRCKWDAGRKTKRGKRKK